MTRIQVLRSIEKAVAAMPASSKIRATTIRLDPEDPIRLLDVTVERAAPGVPRHPFAPTHAQPLIRKPGAARPAAPA